MIWWIIATLAAFFIKGLCGFANTLVFSTILSFGNNNINISPVELILGYPTNLILAFKERKLVKWQVCLPLAALVLIGNIPGIILLKHTDGRIIKVIFGFVIVAIGIEMFIRETQKKKWKGSKIVLAMIGILSGILCGLYGIGALLAAYMSRVADNSSSFKANLCIVFIAENTFRMILYACLGIITINVFKQAILFMPLMLIGLFAGMWSNKILNEKTVKKLVTVMLILSGLALIMNNIG